MSSEPAQSVDLETAGTPPTKLYKYRDLPKAGTEEETFRHDELARTSVYFAPPSVLNDPFELLHDVRMDADEAQIEEHARFVIERRGHRVNARNLRAEAQRITKPELWIQFLERTIDRFGHYCLSRNPDHPLMWAHYAAAHRGYCLEFSIAESDWDLLLVPEAVRYRELRPAVSIRTLLEMRREAQAADMPDRPSVEQWVTETFLTKQACWIYEQEWRLIRSPDQKGPGAQQLPHRLLTGVILGARMDPSGEERLRRWIAERPVKPRLYRTKADPQQFRFHLVELDR